MLNNIASNTQVQRLSLEGGCGAGFVHGWGGGGQTYYKCHLVMHAGYSNLTWQARSRYQCEAFYWGKHAGWKAGAESHDPPSSLKRPSSLTPMGGTRTTPVKTRVTLLGQTRGVIREAFHRVVV